MSRRSGFTLLEVLVTMVVLSIGALAVMKFTSQAQDTMAESRQLEYLCSLADRQVLELERDGFASSLSRSGEFPEDPGYVWSAKSSLLREGGWYRMELVVTNEESGRRVVVERIFRERL